MKAIDPVQAHRDWHGKFEVKNRVDFSEEDILSIAYTPGVAAPCLEIAKNPESGWHLTRRHSLIAVVTDGTAVLGLGDIGPEAAMPVMEGKAVLFKEFGDVDAIPICLNTKDPDEIVRIIKAMEPTFGGINLEDISAPRCFEIERRLIEELNIPVFHDDQHGTAIVTLAGLVNALKVVHKNLSEVRIVINGAGSAAVAIAKLLQAAGAEHLLLCDRKGILACGREDMNSAKEEITARTNPEKKVGTLADALNGADVFIGVSGPGLLSAEMVQSMAKDPVIFACANPVPEIMPDEAKAAGAAVVATGRSDFPNQINNLLAFPGIFRGALDACVVKITTEIKLAAAYAIANMVDEDSLSADFIIPNALDKHVGRAVADAVRKIGAEHPEWQRV